MDDAAKMLAMLRQRRAAMELDAMMAQLDIDTARARIKAAKAQIARIDQMIAHAARTEGLMAKALASGLADTFADGSDSPRRRVGRPRRQPREDLLTSLSLAPEQPAPSADSIRQQRLARQAKRRQASEDGHDAGDGSHIGDDRVDAENVAAATNSQGNAEPAADSMSPVTAQMTPMAMPASRPKRAGGVRDGIIAVLAQAAEQGQRLSLDEIVDRMQQSSGSLIIRNSVRTLLYTMKRDAIATSEGGKWALVVDGG